MNKHCCKDCIYFRPVLNAGTMNSKPIGCVGNGKAIGRIDISERVKVCGLYKTDGLTMEKLQVARIKAVAETAEPNEDLAVLVDNYKLNQELNEMTVKQLRETLTARDISYTNKDTKAKLIAKFK